ncbi:MAG: hypothetical protein FWD73_16375 [Polyangiaceae bacterium]|nr:hypothetical protein [Polyangiaceae bacterium]
MSRLRKFALILFGLAVTVTAGAIACGTTSSTATIFITGIVIRAETLTAGRGCGTAAGQVFQIAAVVYQDNVDPSTSQTTRTFVAANTYDCFTDVTFVNLPLGYNANANFNLNLYLFDASAANALNVPINGTNVPLAQLSTSDPATASAADQALLAGNPTWTTTCTATQSDEVQVLASCNPIAPGTTGVVAGNPPAAATIQLSTSEFAMANGSSAVCTTNAATPDEDASADTNDEPDADASAQPIAFDAVRIRARVGSSIVSTVDLACGTAYVLSPATPAPADFTLDVGLMLAGVAVAQTTCSATATPGGTSMATCTPIP